MYGSIMSIYRLEIVHVKLMIMKGVKVEFDIMNNRVCKTNKCLWESIIG